MKGYIWSRALFGAGTWTLWELDQKYLGSFEMWSWRRMEKISWADRVRNEEVLQSVKKENKFTKTIKERGLIGFVTSCVRNAF